MKLTDGGITAPQGFMAAGVAAGIKKQGKDMALLFSKVPCAAAGTFTSNIVKAAPVLWDRDIIEKTHSAQAVVINSGVANACTGKIGMEYCLQTAKEAGKALGINPELVLTASTGVIGSMLPMDKICSGTKSMAGMLSETLNAGTMAAEAIMTTDTRRKETAVRFETGGREVTIGGMCKGAGMIHPKMCTMLAFLTTDCAIEPALLQKALRKSVEKSFNMVSVDGDTSTNDTCILLANGMAGNPQISEEDDNYKLFCEALDLAAKSLARKIAADGEGATCLLEAAVSGADSYENAVTLAKSVISSSLVKTAVAGRDANWGRILCAMGYSGAVFDPEKVDLYFESENGALQIVSEGAGTDYSEETATKILSAPEVTIRIEMNQGNASAVAWGCDLTHEYININADYRS